jgi:C-terminal processing protease CtpA/Prc
MRPAAGSERLTCLAGLADAWAWLYFYHPDLVVPDERWEEALEAAIPHVERAPSPEGLATAINDTLLATLDDPWTRAVATVAGHAAPCQDEPAASPVSSAILPSGAGYIRSTNVDAYDLPDYLTLMSAAIATVGDAGRVILDLRWGRQPRPWPNLHRRPRFSTEDCWPSCVLGFFIEDELGTPARRERVHAGWSEEGWSLYGEVPVLHPGEPLQPIREPPFFVSQRYPGTRFEDLTTHAGRLAVLVDDDSIGWLDHGLAALQHHRRAIVVHETAGRPRSRSRPVALQGGAQLLSRPYHLVVQEGCPAPPPDRTVPRAADRHDAVVAAEQLLEEATPAVTEPIRSVSMHPRVRPPAKVTGPTASMAHVSKVTRLRGLLKIWAVLGEFFPHLDLADIDWRDGLLRWIPRVEEAEDAHSYYRVLLELGARLNDSHTGTPGIEHPAIDELVGTHTPPVRLGRVEGRPSVIEIYDPAVNPAYQGAIVTELDGRSVEQIAFERGSVRSASTAQALDHWLYEAGGALAGPPDSEVKITLGDEQGSPTVVCRRTVAMGFWLLNRSAPTVRIQGDFGYINLTRVGSPSEFDAVLGSLFDASGLVLDIRGYPGFSVQTDCVRRLVDRPVSSPRFEIPLRSASDRTAWHVSTYEIAPSDSPAYRAPVVVLIDASTISAAEDFCLCLRNAGRVTFVGRPSAGTDGNVTNLHLPGGGRFWFTGMRVLDGEGRRFQNLGIEPDVVVERTRQGAREGRDEILDAGIQTLGRLCSDLGAGPPSQPV